MPATVGVLTFLVLLLLAVQVTYNLYATSAVTAAAADGVRIAAGADAAVSPDRRAAAEAHIRTLLGAYGEQRVQFEWVENPDGDEEILTVRATNPSFLPSALRRPLGFDEIERTVRMRIEREVQP